ncbi:LOW QUALITY PROTEIN: dual specificity phosphatase 28, partial [Menidia menidia]
MLQLCPVASGLLISDGRSACSADLLRGGAGLGGAGLGGAGPGGGAVTLLINVTRQQPFPPGAPEVARLRVPVLDRPDQDLHAHFDRLADAIQAEAARGGRSLVFCKHGRSRSAAVCAAFLMKHRRMGLEQALQRVKTARHVIDPNPGFLAQLQRYEQELKSRPDWAGTGPEPGRNRARTGPEPGRDRARTRPEPGLRT